MRLCLCAVTVPFRTASDRAPPSWMDLRIARATEPDRALLAPTTGTDVNPARTVEEAIYAASKVGFRCLELSIEAVEDYLGIYPLVVLDAFLAEYGCHIGVISGFVLDAAPTENETSRWSLLQARFLEVCINLDGLGGGMLVIRCTADKEHAPALPVLSALAQPYDVQIALECGATESGGRLSLSKGIDLLQQVPNPNVGLAYTADTPEVPPSQQARLDEFTDRVFLLRFPVSDTSGIQAIVEGMRGLCSIKPPAGLNPLEAARAAQAYAASMGLAPTWTASPNRQT